MESYYFRRTRRVPELPLRAQAQARYEFAEQVRSEQGALQVADLAAAQSLSATLNTVREAQRYPESAVRAGELYAAALIQELLRLIVASYVERTDPNALSRAYRQLEAQLGRGDLQATLQRYVATFPPRSLAQGQVTPDVYLTGTLEGVSNRQIALEGLLLLHFANINPAFGRFGELFDDRELAATRYPEVIAGLEQFFTGEPDVGASGLKLFAALRAPIDASPTSLQGQLEQLQHGWTELLGASLSELLGELQRTTGTLREEQKPNFGGGPGPADVLDPAARLRERTAQTGGGAFVPEEYERFSQDSSWMPSVVMLAKSTFVWLGQLSKQYDREISRLDQIPDEELDELAARGFTGLWLIGLWERSKASKTIKNLRGNPDAVASAYSLYDYVIAEDLGGHQAFENLKGRAWQRGIRMASDMVPNHVGVDGRWVVEHPDWFLQLDHPPYPSYTFDGPDLSQDGRVGIFLEDHYYDSSDAAVVFRRLDRETGSERYIYHGNDGTTIPWNDTAQIDYLNAEAREAVIQTILYVARLSPIIRFDAAMTLAKQHVQRLWYPEPGAGGAIASRAQYGTLPTEAFEQAIPHEFWREVVDRVAAEVPDTLLLAEAFWMMEGYFVRTLGMHRVYNSAFMHMFKNEDNANYRLSIKNVLEFEPEILKRFVNFMNNPDEETAVAQFGKDDKYFGVATVMATMPGLPMFGHGQVEGYTEKYGMEYRRAKLDEQPDNWLIDRHRREIFPLLHRRKQFAEVENFQLYDFKTAHGVDENVFVYSNRHGGEASLVAFNNAFGRAQGWVHGATPQANKPLQTLAEGLGLRAGEGDFVTFRDQVSGLNFVRRSRDLLGGIALELEAFKYQVFLDFREVYDADGSYARLHAQLGARGVYDLEVERQRAELEPLHAAFADVVSGEVIRVLRGERGQRQQEQLQRELPERLGTLLERAQAADVQTPTGTFRTQLAHLIALPSLATLAPEHPRREQTEALLTSRLSDAGSGTLYVALVAETLQAAGVETNALRLEPLILETFRAAGLPDPERAQLLATLLPRYAPLYQEGAEGFLSHLVADPDAQHFAELEPETGAFDQSRYQELTVRPFAYALLTAPAAPQLAEPEPTAAAVLAPSAPEPDLEAYAQVFADLDAAEQQAEGKWNALAGESDALPAAKRDVETPEVSVQPEAAANLEKTTPGDDTAQDGTAQDGTVTRAEQEPARVGKDGGKASGKKKTKRS